MDLAELGWNEFWQKHFDSLDDKNLVPVRVDREDKESYLIIGESSEGTAKVSGAFMHKACSRADFPTVGDWVAVQFISQNDAAVIHAVLPRKSSFSRKEPGSRTEEQVLASNVDTAFLVSGLDQNFNLRRIERYITLAWDSGVEPVIVLNKADLCEDLDEHVREVEAIALGVPVLTMSAKQQEGVGSLNAYITKGKTVAFLGSSGVGKSSIVNCLLDDERQKVTAISDLAGKGKHTTTHRELIAFPGGGMMIDTPGMRELQVWGEGDGMNKAFKDIEELGQSCKFRDCKHNMEPGCAVKKAIEDGVLSSERYRSYLKLQKEFQFLSQRGDYRARIAERKRGKEIAKIVRDLQRRRGEG